MGLFLARRPPPPVAIWQDPVGVAVAATTSDAHDQVPSPSVMFA
ncbi:MAG: hypothetical protein R2932_32185 [Caldilineaceae bacterium]